MWSVRTRMNIEEEEEEEEEELGICVRLIRALPPRILWQFPLRELPLSPCRRMPH